MDKLPARRTLADALAAQGEPQQQPRRASVLFTPHWYCKQCLASWGMDTATFRNTQLIPPAQASDRVCEECETNTRCWFIHETVEVTRFKQEAHEQQQRRVGGAHPQALPPGDPLS